MTMSKLLPFRTEVNVARDSPRVVALEGEESEAIFNALASDTSRAIYRALYEEPATASQIAKEVDTSVQNVRYHLQKLEDAGLIDAVDTWYSSRGNEMTVYAALNEALIVAGDKHQSSELRSLFKSSAGALALLAALSAVIHVLAVELFTESVALDQPNTDEQIRLQVVPETIEFVSLEPGIIAFIGGLVLLTAIVGWRYHRLRTRYRG